MNMEWNPQMASLENRLQQQLRPHHPKPEFVTSLKRKLTTEPSVVVERYGRDEKIFFQTAAVVAGLTIGILVVSVLFGRKKN